MASGDQCLRRAADGGRADRRRLREVRRRRVPRRHPHPGPRRDDAVHPEAVLAVAPRARGRARPRRPGAAPRAARRRPDPGAHPGGRPGDQRGPDDQRRHPGGLHLGVARGRGHAAARLRAADARRSARGRRIAVSGPGRATARLPRRPRCGLAARQGRTDHVRDPPRVRGPSLVGADPLQPGIEATQDRPARPAAHGRRQRAVPPRGSGAVRGGAGRHSRRRSRGR